MGICHQKLKFRRRTCPEPTSVPGPQPHHPSRILDATDGSDDNDTLGMPELDTVKPKGWEKLMQKVMEWWKFPTIYFQFTTFFVRNSL